MYDMHALALPAPGILDLSEMGCDNELKRLHIPSCQDTLATYPGLHHEQTPKVWLVSENYEYLQG